MAVPCIGGAGRMRLGRVLIDGVDATPRRGPTHLRQACTQQGRCVAFHGIGDDRPAGKLRLQSRFGRHWRAA